MQDLIDTTAALHYENFRRLKLSEMQNVTNDKQQFRIIDVTF